MRFREVIPAGTGSTQKKAPYGTKTSERQAVVANNTTARPAKRAQRIISAKTPLLRKRKKQVANKICQKTDFGSFLSECTKRRRGGQRTWGRRTAG
jgi:hypothetical protein